MLASSSSGGTCLSRGGAPALAISSSSLRAAFLQVFIFTISTKVGLDAKAQHKYTLMARYRISMKESDS